jgi:hypothetical protein
MRLKSIVSSVRLSTKLSICIVAAVLFAASARAQSKESGFCASRTPQALHSPECKWAFVVQDPTEPTT